MAISYHGTLWLLSLVSLIARRVASALAVTFLGCPVQLLASLHPAATVHPAAGCPASSPTSSHWLPSIQLTASTSPNHWPYCTRGWHPLSATSTCCQFLLAGTLQDSDLPTCRSADRQPTARACRPHSRNLLLLVLPAAAGAICCH